MVHDGTDRIGDIATIIIINLVGDIATIIIINLVQEYTKDKKKTIKS